MVGSSAAGSLCGAHSVRRFIHCASALLFNPELSSVRGLSSQVGHMIRDSESFVCDVADSHQRKITGSGGLASTMGFC